MAQVTLDGVTKFYPGNPQPAVNGVSLDIRDREFIVLVGPSGCGKSTTLRMVAGLEEISSGTIRIDNRVVNEVPPKDRDIAMVFQNYALYPHMTVYKNMSFALRLQRHKLGLTKAQIHERVLEAARMLEISDYLDRKPKALSGGQRQRVAVGRAIVRNPKAFLFDEPLSNLDAKLRVETRAQLKKLHLRLQTTTIYVTHDQEEAMTLGDRVVVMKDGLIQQCAPPLEVYDRPVNRFVAGFLGTPPMNFLNGTVTEGDGAAVCFTFGRQRIRLPDGATTRNGGLAALARRYLGQPLVLGVRPEGLAPRRDGKYNWQHNALAAQLNVIEPLGDKIDLTLSAEAHEHIVCRTDAHEFANLPLGTDITFYMDLGRVHLFEPGDNGINIALATRS